MSETNSNSRRYVFSSDSESEEADDGVETSSDVEYDEVTHCCVCRRIYRDPQKLSCDHSLCKACCDQLTSAGKVVCQLCRQTTAESQIKPDFRRVQVLARLNLYPKSTKANRQEKCEHCDFAKRTNICCKCKQWLCKNCTKIHSKSNASKHHDVISKEDIETRRNLVRNEVVQLAQSINRQESHAGAVNKAIEAIKAEKIRECDQLKQELEAKVKHLYRNFEQKIETTMKIRIEPLQTTSTQANANVRQLKQIKETLEMVVGSDGKELIDNSDGTLKKERVTRLQLDKTSDAITSVPTVKLEKDAIFEAFNRMQGALKIHVRSVRKFHRVNPGPYEVRRYACLSL